MSSYYLTEAYSEIYNPRNVENLYDNLRFVDNMTDTDIQEVIESLVWEFRDYGNTLDEAFDILSFAASDDVICESCDELFNDILSEATVTYGRGDTLARRAAESAARKARRAADSTRRREVRRSRVDGAITKVKQAWAGAKGGLGRASIAAGGAIKKAKSSAGEAANKGKALLGSLLRKGASAAGKALYGAGKAITKSGEKSASAPAITRNIGSKKVTVEPSENAGRKRKTVGGAVSRVGLILQRRAKDNEPAPRKTRADLEATKSKAKVDARKAVGDVFKSEPTAKKHEKPHQLKPNVPGKKENASSGGIKSPNVSIPPEQQGPSQQRLLPPRGVGSYTPGGNPRSKSQQKLALVRAKKAGFAALRKNKQPVTTNEDFNFLFDYLVEDLINAGYASTPDESFNLINNIDENILTEIMSEYLLG